MRNLEIYFDDPFGKRHISDENLRAYSSQHIELLIADGRFTTTATKTLELHEGFFGSTNLEAIKASLRGRLTAEMQLEFQAFKDLASQYEGFVKGLWGKESPEYRQFYPRGITEYHNANLKNVEEKMSRYEAAIREHEAELPATMVAAFLAPKTEEEPGGAIPRWRAARADQEKAKAETTAKKRDAKAARAELTVQMKRNILTVALEMAGKPEEEWREALRLFPQYLLEPVSRRGGAEKVLGSDAAGDEGAEPEVAVNEEEKLNS